ncbi:polysaccharide deacetylase family protein [Proteobacteria bacterium 005FR1]|nr:polysaccharide deacetylase family protein [Proteobacteria bacterium 005FR1]
MTSIPLSLSSTMSFLSRSTAAAGLSSLTIGSHVTIFALHRPVSPEHDHRGLSPDFLRSALDRLKCSGYNFVSLEEVLTRPNQLPPKPVCLTMDDGFADQAELLAPVLAEYRTKTTFFLITGFIDRIDWPWDEKVAYLIKASTNSVLEGLEPYGLPEKVSIESANLRDSVRRLLQKKGKELPAEKISDLVETLAKACDVEVPALPPRGYEALTWDQARDLEKQGLRLAPHSVNHHITSRLSLDDARAQFAGSWKRLQEELENPAKIYCYPTGRLTDFGQEHEQALASMGYLGAVSFVSTPLRMRHMHAQRYRLPRIAFPNTLTAVFRYASWIEALRSFAQPVR